MEKLNKVQVLISGAGPTGLVLALWLIRSGISIRLIDKSAKAGTTSRAVVVHARTLEFYHQLGIDQLAIRDGIKWYAANLWRGGAKVGRVPFGNIEPAGSPYPYGLIFPQDLHEEMLEKQLNLLNIKVERHTELTSFEQNHAGIRVKLKKENGETETCDTAFLAGCEGAHSIIREQLGINFSGGTYEDIFFVADLLAGGPVVNGEMHIALDEEDFLAIFPMKGNGKARLVGNLKKGINRSSDLGWDDVHKGIVDRLQMNIEEVNWFSTYKVHHRVADYFREQNVFLLGDAAHIHSPVGGQGMNTGIGDAVNLAWKLAEVLQGNASESILDSYEQERKSFAVQLVKTTDRAFAVITSGGAMARWVRLKLVPWLFPKLFQIKFMRWKLFRLMSQIEIKYPKSILSMGSAGKIKGGDRLPWIRFETNDKTISDNFECLSTLKWQVHIYGDGLGTVKSISRQESVPVHFFPWNTEMKIAGLKKNALYLIRPDGYVAVAADGGNERIVADYIDRIIINNSK